MDTSNAVAVLCSGGLDSAVLVADQAEHAIVHPIYVVEGLAWEDAELAILRRFLDAISANRRIRPLVTLEMPIRDIYPPTHWAITGQPPGYDTPDEDVYLVGRNLTLLAKAAVYCALHRIGRIAIGPLAGNPFPDARPVFLEAIGRAFSLGLDADIAVEAPFLTLQKSDVIKRGTSLKVPLAMTVSCMNPIDGRHCGACSKCRERRDAFRDAGIPDPTEYRSFERGTSVP